MDDGGHFAERCQGFILIAIGESLVVIGASLASRLDAGSLTGAEIAAFVIAVIGSVALWWVYFDEPPRTPPMSSPGQRILAGSGGRPIT